jgi:transcriptional regulator with XRE-family HTH domain
MSIVVHPGRLRHEMVRRGWAATDLAREARLSNATVSAALAGRAVSEQSLALIAKALSRAAVVEIIDVLLARDGGELTLD